MTSVFNLNITINNVLLKINLTKIRTILHLSLLLNKSKKTTVFIEIPRFCFHPRLPIAGNCRMCLIELFKAPKLVVACTTRVQEGMVLFTNSNLVKKARENLLEFFLANHPLDCPICDQGGECDLQNQLEVFGLDHTRYNENIKKVSKVINIGVISFQMTRCIHCTRCVRFLTNVADNFHLGVIARGNKMKISKYINMYLYNEFLSNIVDLCPVGYLIKMLKKKANSTTNIYFSKQINYYYCGALTTTNTAYKIRSWELYSKYTVDILDNIGADIRVDLKGTDLIRILPRINQEVNDYWITDITRYALNGVKVQRILVPYFKNRSNKYIGTTWANILDIYVKYLWMSQHILHKNMNITSLTGNLTDAKTGLSLKYFSNLQGTSNIESRVVFNKNLDLNFIENFSINTAHFQECDVLFLLGVNLRLESPFYNLRLKKKKKLLLVTCGFCGLYSMHKNVQHFNLGLTLKKFFQFLEGKSILNNIILQNNSLKNFLFLAGSAVLQRSDCSNLINGVNFFIKKFSLNGYFNIIQPNIGRITCNFLNIIPGHTYLLNNNSLSLKKWKNIFKNSLKITYNLSADDYYKLYNKFFFNNFHILIGHTYSNNFANIALLLPTTTFFEKETFYLNIEGVLRQSKIISAPNANTNVLVDWQIFFLLLKKNYLEFKTRAKNINNFFLRTFFFEKKLVQVLATKKLTMHFDLNYLTWNYIFFAFVQNKVKGNINFFQSFFITQKIKILNIFLCEHFINLYLQQIDKYLILLYYNKYWLLDGLSKTFFFAKKLEPVLEKQLLKHSRLFLLKNQYAQKELVNHIKLWDNKFYYNKFLFINYPLAAKYRGYYNDNIISKHTLDINKIKTNIKLLMSNYNL